VPTRSLARHRVVAAASLALVLILGCGGAKPVSVSGKLVFPAKVKVADTDSISVTFVPEDGGAGKGAVASVNAKDLTFTGDVLPGKYKLGVAVQPYAGMKDTEARTKELDKVLGQFGATATSLRYEVTNDAGQSITIDLAKGTVSK
jgi:hypothetical protein